MKVLIILCFVLFSICQNKHYFLKNHLKEKYTEIMSLLNSTVSANPDFKHSAYNRLAYIVDTFGPRLWGSETLEIAMRELYNQIKTEGFENVKLEPVKDFIQWVRGEESLTLLSIRPTPTKLNVIGLGRSVGGNVTAEVIVVSSFDELVQKKRI